MNEIIVGFAVIIGLFLLAMLAWLALRGRSDKDLKEEFQLQKKLKNDQKDREELKKLEEEIRSKPIARPSQRKAEEQARVDAGQRRPTVQERLAKAAKQHSDKIGNPALAGVITTMADQLMKLEEDMRKAGSYQSSMVIGSPRHNTIIRKDEVVSKDRMTDEQFRDEFFRKVLDDEND